MSGSSNFLQFNPGGTNMETDSQYSSDPARSGGLPFDSIFASNLANKLFYQMSTGLAALCQAMANKGYAMSDANYSNLIAAFQNIRTNADQRGEYQQVPVSSSVSCNVAQYTGFALTLTSNTTISVGGQSAGDVVVFLIAQNGAGGHTVTWPANFSQGAWQPDPTPNSYSMVAFFVDGALNFHALTPMISAAGIGNVPIGQNAASTGKFTTLTATAATSLQAATATSLTAGTVTGSTSVSTPTLTVSGTSSLAAASATTPSATDNSTRVATTAWNLLGFSVSLGSSGYIKFPTWLGGAVFQWARGVAQSTSGYTQTVNWSIPFPNNCFIALATTLNPSPTDTNMSFYQSCSWSQYGVIVFLMRNADHAFDTVTPLCFAIGN